MTAKVVRDLKLHPQNPRTISEKRRAQLAKSMAKFGDLSSITVNRRTGHVVSGHQRVRALLPNASIYVDDHHLDDGVGTVAIGHIQSGDQRWPYREVDWDEATEKSALIAANAAGGDFDELLLAPLVLELDRAGVDTELLNLRSLDEILAEGKAEASASEDDFPDLPATPRAKRGDVWVLGEHRIMCGDSTSRDDMQRLMGNEVAAMEFTDPPYGVAYKGTGFDVIEGDRKRDDELLALVTGALKQGVHFTAPDAAFYVWHASSTRREFEDALRDAGLVERQYLVWAKNSIVLGHSDYRWSHEPCFYASKDGRKPAFYGDRAQATVWRATLRRAGHHATTLGQGVLLVDGKGGQVALVPRLPKGKKARTVRLYQDEVVRVEVTSQASDVLEVGHDRDYVHPTQKPVELARRAIANSSRPGEVVLDQFGGSGSTLIACETEKRRARLMEIDPRYVDAEVKRWETLTGRTAVLEER